MVDYRVFGVGVLIQSGGKRPRAPCPQSLAEVPGLQFVVFFEIIHTMCAGYKVTWEVSWPLIGQNVKMTNFAQKLCEMTQEDVFGRELRSKRQEECGLP